jgi:hypothetical protein
MAGGQVPADWGTGLHPFAFLTSSIGRELAGVAALARSPLMAR